MAGQADEEDGLTPINEDNDARCCFDPRKTTCAFVNWRIAYFNTEIFRLQDSFSEKPGEIGGSCGALFIVAIPKSTDYNNKYAM